MRHGPLNLITDVEGIAVGNTQDARIATGVTVALFEPEAVASVAITGGAPAGRCGAGPRTSKPWRFSAAEGPARLPPGVWVRARLVSTTTVLERPWLKLCFTTPALTDPVRGFRLRGGMPGLQLSLSSVMRSLD